MTFPAFRIDDANNFPCLGNVSKCHVSRTLPKHRIDERQYSACMYIYHQFRIHDIS